MTQLRVLRGLVALAAILLVATACDPPPQPASPAPYLGSSFTNLRSASWPRPRRRLSSQLGEAPTQRAEGIVSR